MKRLASYVLLILSLSGCAATINSQVMPGVNFTQYKIAYLETQKKDEFLLASEIAYQLADIGMHGGEAGRSCGTCIVRG